ncbi:MAG: hypothetical protein ABIS18_04875 [Actinomycetota bacterium]
MSRWMKAVLASVVTAVLIVPSVAAAHEAKGERQKSRQQARERKAECRVGVGPLGRHITGRHIVHAGLKVQTKDGFTDLTVDIGSLTNADADSLTLKRADDQTVSARRAETTKVCRDGKKVAFADLKEGDGVRIVAAKDGTLKAVMARSGPRATRAT